MGEGGIGIVKSEGYRVFILAIILSLFWHIFWLSVIKVIPASGPKSPIRFSRVSFLGPILSKDAAGLRLEPKELSFLEKRYFEMTGSLINTNIDSGPSPHVYNRSVTRPSGEEGMASLVSEAVSGQKLEPCWTADRRRFADMTRI